MAPAIGGGGGVEGAEHKKLLPLVLLLHSSPTNILHLEERLLNKFRCLKPWEEPSMSTQHFLTTHAQSVKALLCMGLHRVDSEILRCLPSLQCVATTSVGVDHIDMAECRRRGIAVTNAGAAFAEDAADFAVGLVLDVLRRISAADRFVRRGMWPLKGEYPLGSKVLA